MAIDRLERLTNLVALLLHSPAPVSLVEIVEQVPGYPAGVDARRQAFERDKRLLREEGIPVVEAAGRYRVRPEDYYLAPLDLDEEERVALQVAAAAVGVGAGDAQLGVVKLAGAAPAAPGLGVRADLAGGAHLPALHAAARARSTVRFAYGGSERVVEPWGLLARGGHWYLVGHDRGRGARRTFRVDRFEGPVAAGPPGEFDGPDRVDLAGMPRAPWLAAADGDASGEGPVTAVVALDAVVARRVAAELGDAAAAEPAPGGGAVVRIAVANRAVFRSWLLDLLDHAEVREPPALRAEVAGWLAAVAGAPART